MLLDFDNAVNIFTDCSTYRGDTDKMLVSCGYCIVVDNEVVEHNNIIIDDSNNAQGELFAILMGVIAANRFKERGTRINLFSDSKTSIRSLTHNIFNWYDNSLRAKHGGFTNIKGGCIKYQELYLNIVEEIVSTGLKINFYHVRSHNRYHQESVHMARTYFNKVNNTNTSDDIVRDIIYYNNFVDKMTRHRLHDVCHEESFDRENYRQFRYPVTRQPSKYQLDQYRRLVC